MKDLIRCDNCNGRKRVLGMGGMEKPCETCKAIGWIETDKPAVKVEGLKTPAGNPVAARKKPGPKPKAIAMEI